jgi:transketolase
MVHRANASHIGGVLSMADIIGVLYAQVLNVRPDDPHWIERDRFVLSKGHCCAGLYAALAERGFFPTSELEQYGMDGSRLMTHACHLVPGVEFSTGSLGHGLPYATGLALAAKKKNASWRCYALLSDGELDEGSNWESILFAPQHQLENLMLIIDYNKIQSLGSVEDIIDLRPLPEKFAAFGWSVREVNGHDHAQLGDALGSTPWAPGKPSCVIAHTIKGNGIDYMENNLQWHYSAPNADLLRSALDQLDGTR